MYGKDFHQWREAQEIIAEIEAQEPEVREMVKRRYSDADGALALANLQRSMIGVHSPGASLMRQIAMQPANAQYEAFRHGCHASPFGGIFGFFGR